MTRKIIQSHKMVFVCIILYMAAFFAAKLGYEAASGQSVTSAVYTGGKLK